MSDLDRLMKGPELSRNKRKLDPAKDPNEIYKASKSRTNGDARSNGHKSTVVDDELPDEDDDDLAGPELPPGEDMPDANDEDGRFFGGGISRNAVQALDFVDQQANTDTEQIDAAWLRKRALAFERKISRNAELRGKYEDQPPKFLQSETELDAAIKELSSLAEHPELYPSFVDLGSTASLVSLLAHENIDIAADTLQIIEELTDEDVEASEGQLLPLLDAMLEADLPSLLLQNLGRFDESQEGDSDGVNYGLGIIENLASQPGYAEKIVSGNEILPWLLARAGRKEAPVSQNKQYAAEVMTVLVQTSQVNRTRLLEKEGIELHLQLLSAYRRRDPKSGTSEEEFMENLFDTVVCLVEEDLGRNQFVASEGIELCLIMMREGSASKSRALRILDHALGTADDGGSSSSVEAVAARLVEAAGLRTVFGMLMRKSKQDAAATEHILGIISSLFRILPAESPERIRLLAKFIEKDYQKIARLIDLRLLYMTRLKIVNEQIESEKSEIAKQKANRNPVENKPEGDDDSVAHQLDAEWLSRRLNTGLFAQQTIDLILAWLVAEDSGAKSRITALLERDGESLVSIRSTLQEQLKSRLESLDGEAGSDSRAPLEMLQTLSDFL